MTKTWAAPFAVVLLGAAAAVPHGAAAASGATPPLDLGPAGLAETRTVQVVQPGVTHTTIRRGTADPSVRWVVEVSIPGGASSPDPDAPPRAIQDEASARTHAAKLDAAGFPAQAQQVLQPAVADVAAGVLGWRVRLTETFATKAAADAAAARLAGAGFSGRSWYAGWDGTSTARGPWVVHVVTIDPKRFRGTVGGSFGPTLQTRETTSWLAGYEKASVAVNAGFFVFDPRAGAEGDPAGAGVYGGVLESEPVGSRPVLALDPAARHTQVVRPTWSAGVALPTGDKALDGVNRVPGLIRNCGGTADDVPTALPLHDVTCTDPDELVLFTTAFGPTTPSGAGAEAVLDARGRVLRVLSHRGTALAVGERSL
jgi:hypothetical protein